MKKIYSLIVVLSLLLTACQKELHFDTPPVGNGTTNGGTTGGNTSTDCKACVYMPVCNGSWYTYLDTLATAPSVTTDTLRFVKDTTIDSKTFVKIYSPLSKSTTYYNCTDGATRLITYNLAVSTGTVLAADITFIKANLPVGGTWTDKLANPLGQEVDYNSKIVEKGITRTLSGKTYTDVIHVNTETGVNAPGFGFIATNSTDYYFAKGIGLIEAVLTDASGTFVIEHKTIKAYYIP